MRRVSAVGWLLIVVGVLLVVLGVIYFTTTAANLPSFIPGHIGHADSGKYKKRGVASIVVALIAFAGVYVIDFRRRSQ
jgi:amino acid permease